MTINTRRHDIGWGIFSPLRHAAGAVGHMRVDELGDDMNSATEAGLLFTVVVNNNRTKCKLKYEDSLMLFSLNRPVQGEPGAGETGVSYQFWFECSPGRWRWWVCRQGRWHLYAEWAR